MVTTDVFNGENLAVWAVFLYYRAF